MRKISFTLMIVLINWIIQAQQQKPETPTTTSTVTETTVQNIAKLTKKIIFEKTLCLNDIIATLEPATEIPLSAQNLLSSLCMSELNIQHQDDNEARLSGTILYGNKKFPISIGIGTTPNEKKYTFSFQPGIIKLSSYIPALASLEKFAQFGELHIIVRVPQQKTAKTNIRIQLSTNIIIKLGTSEPLELNVMVSLPTSTEKIAIKAQLLGAEVNKPYYLIPNIAAITIKNANIELAENKFAILFDGDIRVLDHTSSGQLIITSNNGMLQGAMCTTINKQTSFQNFSKHFDSFDNIMSIDNATLTVATANTPIACGTSKEINAGINLDATISFKGTIGTFLQKIGISSIHSVITIPPSPTKLDELQISVEKKLDTAKKLGPIKIQNIAMNITGGHPLPTIGISLDAEVSIPGSTKMLNVVFNGDISATSINLSGGAICKREDIGESCDVIDSPFGIPINIANPFFGISITEGTPTGFTIKGDAELGNSDINVDCTIDLIKPTKSVIDMQAKHLCLSDLSTLWVSIANKVGEKVKMPQITIPSFACFDDSSIHVSLTQVVPDIAISLNFNLFGVNATLDGTLNTTGLSLQGFMDPVYKAGLFSLTSSQDPTKGAAIDLQLNIIEQQAIINGKINMLGGLISRDVQINATSDGLHFEVEITIAGNVYKIAAHFPIETNKKVIDQDWQLSGEITLGFVDLLIQGLKQSANAIVTEIEKPIQDLENAKRECEKAPEPLETICKASFKIAQLPLEGAQLAINGVKNGFTRAINTLRVSKASFSASLSQIKTGILPELQVDLMLLNKPLQIKVDKFDIRNPINSLTQLNKKLAEDILSEVLSPAVNDALNTLKKITRKITGKS